MTTITSETLQDHQDFLMNNFRRLGCPNASFEYNPEYSRYILNLNTDTVFTEDQVRRLFISEDSGRVVFDHSIIVINNARTSYYHGDLEQLNFVRIYSHDLSQSDDALSFLSGVVNSWSDPNIEDDLEFNIIDSPPQPTRFLVSITSNINQSQRNSIRELVRSEMPFLDIDVEVDQRATTTHHSVPTSSSGESDQNIARLRSHIDAWCRDNIGNYLAYDVLNRSDDPSIFCIVLEDNHLNDDQIYSLRQYISVHLSGTIINFHMDYRPASFPEGPGEEETEAEEEDPPPTLIDLTDDGYEADAEEVIAPEPQAHPSIFAVLLGFCHGHCSVQ